MYIKNIYVEMTSTSGMILTTSDFNYFFFFSQTILMVCILTCMACLLYIPDRCNFDEAAEKCAARNSFAGLFLDSALP